MYWTCSRFCKVITVEEIVTKASYYNQEISQSHTADQLKAPGGRAMEHSLSQDIKKTVQAKQPALFTINVIAKLDGLKVLNNKQGPNTEPQQTIVAKISRLRRDSSLNDWGLKCILLVPNIHPRCCCF